MYPELNNPEHWFMSISPEGIGFLGMILNISLALIISSFTKPPPEDVVKMVERIRLPQ